VPSARTRWGDRIASWLPPPTGWLLFIAAAVANTALKAFVGRGCDGTIGAGDGDIGAALGLATVIRAVRRGKGLWGHGLSGLLLNTLLILIFVTNFDAIRARQGAARPQAGASTAPH
jgi:hypothetical protein